MNASKDELRREAIWHRDRIGPAPEDHEAACRLFFDHIRPQPGQVVAAYWPKGKEFNTYPVMEELVEHGCTCALPVVQNNERALRFLKWDKTSSLEKGTFGIYHPPAGEAPRWLEPDILIVPLLAFDRRGNRLGYGKGHYDATLAGLRKRKKIVAVGMGYAQQAVLFNLPSDAHDEKLDWVITPQKAWKFE